MKIQLILSCILGAALQANAVETAMTYTYAGDVLRSWGRFKSEIYDVAIRICDPALAGRKITAIRAVLNADEGIASTSVWLSKELTLEKIDGVKVTVPDICSSEVAVEKVTLPGKDGTYGQLEATLDTPYELTEDGVYVGYSLTVPSAAEGEALTDKQKQPVLVSPCDNPESLYIRASKDIMAWKSFYGNLLSGAAIYVSLEGEYEEYCLDVETVAPAYAAVDGDFTVRATVENHGIHPVSQIGYSYSMGGKDFEATYDLETPIQPDFFAQTDVYLPVAAVTELGDYTLDMKLTGVNGHANASEASSASAPVSVLPFVPVHRPMLEEFTGTWCGWCMRGYFALDALNALYGDRVVLAAYHTDDAMAAPALPVDISGCPSSTLNRNGIEDPYMGRSGKGFGMKKEVFDSMESLAIADIDVNADWADEGKTSISVRSEARFIKDVPDAGYKFGYLLINNGLTGTGQGWIQSNTYANDASVYTGTEFEVLTTLPSKIIGMVFDDVVVDVTAMRGIDGSIPSDVVFDVPYANEYTIDIANNGIIQDKDALYVAAFIINPDGTILNSRKVKVGEEMSVKMPGEKASVVEVEYFSISGVRVAEPHDGIFLKVSRMSDGTVRTEKLAR